MHRPLKNIYFFQEYDNFRDMIMGKMQQNILTNSLLSQAKALSTSTLSVFRSFVSKSGIFGPEAEGHSGADSGISIFSGYVLP